jgi:hypothetical protein
MPMHAGKLGSEERFQALRNLTVLKQKFTGKIKGRGCTKPDEEEYKKLTRVIKYLRYTRYLALTN